ncbi:hypothetical protein LG047_02490 [Methylocystis sp. WRRC1]|uniref:hypothetical protein n=1 Tax=Methylocystis sp. WRRC1 TaxID=1732014 RepID=UPI001D14D9EA|nr:hypothetical protein [Methylocystis sp. WRRC1]MCC3244200.1 hypothetical protein [Methylocystis sp. WRRC1]
MIDIDGDAILELLRRAEQFALLDGPRLERELDGVRLRAAAAFAEAGDDELSAFFRADAIVTRLRGMIERRRARLRPPPGGDRKL